MAERTVLAQARLAREAGAAVMEKTKAHTIVETVDGVEVLTADGRWSAPVAVVTAGPWVKPLLAQIGVDLPITSSIEQSAHYQCNEPIGALPTIVDHTPEPLSGPWEFPSYAQYAIADPERAGVVKMGLSRSGPIVDPDTRSFEYDQEGAERLDRWAEERFIPLERHEPPETCLATIAPDYEFIIDRIGKVVIGSACSGHGFKFTPLLGKIYADLATGETVPHKIGAFAATRSWEAREIADRAFDS